MTISTLGGDERVTIMLLVSLDPKDQWPNHILENSRYFRMSLSRTGTLEQFHRPYDPKTKSRMPKFRKRKVRSIDDMIKKINQYIGAIQ